MEGVRRSSSSVKSHCDSASSISSEGSAGCWASGELGLGAMNAVWSNRSGGDIHSVKRVILGSGWNFLISM